MHTETENSHKNFEAKLLKILNHISQNWGVSSQYIKEHDKDWHCFHLLCADDLGSSVGVVVSYTLKEATVLEVDNWDDPHYTESAKVILDELKKMGVKNTDTWKNQL